MVTGNLVGNGDELDLVEVRFGWSRIDEPFDLLLLRSTPGRAAVENGYAAVFEIVDPVFGTDRVSVHAPRDRRLTGNAVMLSGRRRIGGIAAEGRRLDMNSGLDRCPFADRARA